MMRRCVIPCILLIILLTVFTVIPCHSQPCEWPQIYPSPSGYFDVWGYSDPGYFVAGFEDVYRHGRAGYSPMNTGMYVPEQIWTDSSEYLFGCSSYHLFHYNGITWDVEYNPSGMDPCIWGNSPSDVFVGYGNRHSYATSNGHIKHFNGTTWEDSGSWPREGSNIRDIYGVSSTEVYAVTSYYYEDWITSTIYGPYFYLYRYDGAAWSVFKDFGSFDATTIFGFSSTDIFIGGTNSSGPVIYRYNGSTLGFYTEPPEEAWELWGTSSSDLYTIGVNKVYHFDGSVWEESLDAGVAVFDIWGSSPDNIIAVCANKIFQFDGYAWAMTGGRITSEPFSTIWAGSPGDIFVADHEGSILHLDGTQWTHSYYEWYQEIHDIWGSSPTDVYAAGGNLAFILHYDGITWTRVHTYSASEFFTGIWGFSTTEIYAIGENALSKYDGVTWRNMPNPPPGKLYDIWGTSGTNLYATGDAGMIVRFDGASWSQMVTGSTDDLHCIWGSSGTNIYSSGLHYDGITWTYVDMGPYDIMDIWGSSDTDVYVATFYDIRHFNGVTWDYTYTTVYLPTCIFGASPDDVYVGTYKGKIHKLDCSSRVPSSTVIMLILYMVILPVVLVIRILF